MYGKGPHQSANRGLEYYPLAIQNEVVGVVIRNSAVMSSLSKTEGEETVPFKGWSEHISNSDCDVWHFSVLPPWNVE